MTSTALPSFFRLDSPWQSYFHSAVLLMVLGMVTLIARLVKETHRGRVVSRQNAKKSDHRIEQSPRRPDTKLDIPNTQSKSNRPPPPDKPYLDVFPDLSRSAELASEKDRNRMIKDKELYWKLQNIEDHRDVVPEARTRLVELFDQTLSESLNNPSDTIVSIPSYDPTSLRNFLQSSHRSAARRYEAYLGRRKAGGPREMFPTEEYALEWLRLAGVVKYVDGGWLGGILGVGNGRASCLPETGMNGQDQDGPLERMVAKMAWQVISEEFGDGDLQKNHIHLYEKHLNDIKAGRLRSDGSTSLGHMKGFDGLKDDQGVPRCWEAAIAQQCIGLLASTREFFPEALGFNMAYESLPYHLLVTARELQELKIDNYYFAIHVTIDNADSGHSAMARMAVERYLEGVRTRDGEEAMKNVWKRVQTGYILAEGLPTTPSGPVEFEPAIGGPEGKTCWQPRKAPQGGVPTPAESRLVEVIMRKANAAEKMHCTSRMKIGQYTVEEWLDPTSLSQEKTLSFTRALASKRPFVIPGEPEKSRFVRDLEWGGKMFGAFTGSESEVVKGWIISLQPKTKSEGTYEKFVGPIKPRSDRGVIPNTAFAQRADDLWTIHDSSPIPPLHLNCQISALDLISQPSFTQATSIDYRTIRPIWYIATSLFECFPLQPSHFATPLGMASLRLIRSQVGFGALHLPEDICAGTDDLVLERQNDMSGLWELGEKLDLSCQIRSTNDINSLAQDTPEGRVDQFCAKLLDIRARPYADSAGIFGVCLALCKGLHSNEGIGEMLEEEKDRRTLRRIVDEQIATIMEFTVYQVERKEVEWEEGFVRGFTWAKEELLAML